MLHGASNHDFGGSRKKALSELPAPLLQGLIEFHGFKDRDRHALAIHRIEAANRVAEHEEVPARKSIHAVRIVFARWPGNGPLEVRQSLAREK